MDYHGQTWTILDKTSTNEECYCFVNFWNAQRKWLWNDPIRTTIMSKKNMKKWWKNDEKWWKKSLTSSSPGTESPETELLSIVLSRVIVVKVVVVVEVKVLGEITNHVGLQISLVLLFVCLLLLFFIYECVDCAQQWSVKCLEIWMRWSRKIVWNYIKYGDVKSRLYWCQILTYLYLTLVTFPLKKTSKKILLQRHHLFRRLAFR